MTTNNENKFSPNEGQTKAIEIVGEFLEDEDAFECGLYGSAGTGKSTVCQYVFGGYSGRIAMSAPTHKAVGVLSEMAADRGLPARIETIHKLLSLKKQYNDGEIEFVPDPKRVPMIESYDLLVVDECSMIGPDLAALVRPYIDAQRVKVIWMGDYLQLPPVAPGSELRPSPTFEAPVQHTLTEVMRNGGIIGEAVANIRDNIEAVDPQLARAGSDELGEIEVFGSRLWFRRFLSELEDKTTDVQALAFTNRSVNWINANVRKAFFGADAPSFVEGERLVGVSTHEQFGSVCFYTGARMTVLSAERGSETIGSVSGSFELPCWFLEVQFGENGRKDVISVLDEQQKSEYRKRLKAAKQAALKDRGLWGYYYELKERFADVRPGYATTIHKSQGSTYDRVYLAQTDVMNSTDPDVPEFRNRLLYVGYSRTRSKLTIC